MQGNGHFVLGVAMSSMVLVVEFGWQRAVQVTAEQTGEDAGLAPREEAGAANTVLGGP